MCFYADEYCDVYREEIVKARKPHKCAECPREVSPGEHYLRVTALFEGSWDCYSVCRRCQWVRWTIACWETEHQHCARDVAWPLLTTLFEVVRYDSGEMEGLVLPPDHLFEIEAPESFQITPETAQWVQVEAEAEAEAA